MCFDFLFIAIIEIEWVNIAFLNKKELVISFTEMGKQLTL